MTTQHFVSLSTPVAEILERWHFTAPLFFKYHMRCPICELIGFETLEDVLRIYDVAPNVFLVAINQMIAENHTQSEISTNDP